MLKRIAQNKYKVMAFITGIYLLVDVWQHPGQARVLFPKQFTGETYAALQPQQGGQVYNPGKNWVKAVNTRDKMNQLTAAEPGFECDVYFNSATAAFEVHHDPGTVSGFSLDDLLQIYRQKKLPASIWLDIKNLDGANASSCLTALVSLREKYTLQNRILVESKRADLLPVFSDSNFFTAYYVPIFNPYRIDKRMQQYWADSIAAAISRSKINALSGYYFQSSFLKHYFPRYLVLTWVENNSGSLVNALFHRKINADTTIFIALHP